MVASIWQLSKDSMKGFELLDASADLLFALEQLRSKKVEIVSPETSESLRRGQLLLEKLEEATRSQVDKTAPVDPFVFRVVSAVQRAMSLTPSKLREKLSEVKKELSDGKVSPESVSLLENICEQLTSLTAKRVDALSPSLH